MLENFQDYQGPAWIFSFALLLGVLSKYILQPFFNFFYKDFLKDYWKKRLEILNNQRDSVMSYTSVIDLVEGKYHLLARQLISYSIIISERYINEELKDNEILMQLRTNMHESIQRAKNDLSRYTAASNSLKLNQHLIDLTKKDILQFYSPIIAAIHESRSGDKAKLRDVILFQIDLLTTEALTILTSRKRRKNA